MCCITPHQLQFAISGNGKVPGPDISSFCLQPWKFDLQEVVTIGVPLFCFQTCSFVKLARVSVTESDSLQLSNERQDIWYDVMNDKDVNNISRNFDFHRQHIIPCNAREIKNNFLDNLNCWLKQIYYLTLPVPPQPSHRRLGSEQ